MEKKNNDDKPKIAGAMLGMMLIGNNSNIKNIVSGDGGQDRDGVSNWCSAPYTLSRFAGLPLKGKRGI